MMFFAALLLLAAAQDAPRQPPSFTVKAPDGSKQIFLGFVAIGNEASLARLDTAAKAINLATARADQGAKLELMVFFDSKTSKKAANALYEQARSGAFGTLETGMMLVPKSAVGRN